jgi:hypothetical protein
MHYATSRKVAGSRPYEVNNFHKSTYFFRLNQALRFTQILTEIGARNKYTNFLESRVPMVFEADKFTAICGRIT